MCPGFHAVQRCPDIPPLPLSQAGERLKEAGKINTSLLTLARVIESLGSGNGHVSFRDSKLTRILQPSLVGNTRTAVICCVSPALKFQEETRSTLGFASRAKNISTSISQNEILTKEDKMMKMAVEMEQVRGVDGRCAAFVAVADGRGVSQMRAQMETVDAKEMKLDSIKRDAEQEVNRTMQELATVKKELLATQEALHASEQQVTQFTADVAALKAALTTKDKEMEELTQEAQDEVAQLLSGVVGCMPRRRRSLLLCARVCCSSTLHRSTTRNKKQKSPSMT